MILCSVAVRYESKKLSSNGRSKGVTCDTGQRVMNVRDISSIGFAKFAAHNRQSG